MRLRLLAVIVGVVGLVLIIHDVPLAGHLERVERDRLVTGLERDAFILAGRSEEALEAGTASDDPTLARLVADYSRLEDVRVVVVDGAATGVLGSEIERTVGIGFGNRPEIVRALDGIANSGERRSETLGEELFYVAVPVLSGDDVVGAVRFSAPERVVSDRTASRVRRLFVVAAISLAIAGFVAWLLSLMVTRPLARLRTATHDLAGGELGTRAPTDTGPPEVRELAGSFNTMADRLEQLIERQRAFAGTASHQLRTPLTALRLRLGQLETEVADRPAAQRHLDAAVAECERLHRMTEGLLALSRAERGGADAVATDLAAVVTERVDQWRPLAEERDLTIELGARSTSIALALPGSVEQVVDNLVDNAMEAVPAGGRLELCVVDEIDPDGRTMVAIHVADDGPGLSDDERARAFDRFWRGAGAGPSGSGLGLAIVRELVEVAGGTARLDRSRSGGIDAVASFPRRR